jgi:hypothetical protein
MQAIDVARERLAQATTCPKFRCASPFARLRRQPIPSATVSSARMRNAILAFATIPSSCIASSCVKSRPLLLQCVLCKVFVREGLCARFDVKPPSARLADRSKDINHALSEGTVDGGEWCAHKDGRTADLDRSAEVVKYFTRGQFLRLDPIPPSALEDIDRSLKECCSHDDGRAADRNWSPAIPISRNPFPQPA